MMIRIARGLILLLFMGCGVCYAQIPPLYTSVSNEYRIPSILYFAVATQESRLQTKEGLPWPWTLNINRKAHYYETKAEAVTALRAEIVKKTRPLGVGIMQIEWPIWGDRADSPEQMMDPVFNLQLGAWILNHYREMAPDGSWWTAISYYHAGPRPGHAAGKKYQQHILRRIMEIKRKIDKGLS